MAIAAKKYEGFFGGPVYREFRAAAAERMIVVLAAPKMKDHGEDRAKRFAFSIVDREMTRSHDAVSRTIQNFIDDKTFPMNPVFDQINSRLELASGEAEIDKKYRPILVKLADLAVSLV